MKLQFEENEYYLMKDGEELAIATTDESFIKELGAERLSLKNCQEIENGYDLLILAYIIRTLANMQDTINNKTE